MNSKIIDLFKSKYQTCNVEFIKVVSTRWISWKLNLSKSQVEYTINKLKAFGMIKSVKGQGNWLNVPLFKSHFLFSSIRSTADYYDKKIKYRTINIIIEKNEKKGYDITYKRELYLGDKIYALTMDKIFQTNLPSDYIQFGFHNMVRKDNNKPLRAIVTDTCINLKGTKESEKIDSLLGIFQKTSIIDIETNSQVALSYSISPINFYSSKYIKLFY